MGWEKMRERERERERERQTDRKSDRQRETDKTQRERDRETDRKQKTRKRKTESTSHLFSSKLRNSPSPPDINHPYGHKHSIYDRLSPNHHTIISEHS